MEESRGRRGTGGVVCFVYTVDQPAAGDSMEGKEGGQGGMANTQILPLVVEP